MNRVLAGFSILSILFIVGCLGTGKETEAERKWIITMTDDVLSELSKQDPRILSEIYGASGYAVFRDPDAISESFGVGYGVVKNKKTGKHTFMRMGKVGADLDYKIKNFDLVFVFQSIGSVERFIEHGWTDGDDKDIAIYELTESGFSLPVSVKEAKYWKEDSLN